MLRRHCQPRSALCSLSFMEKLESREIGVERPHMYRDLQVFEVNVDGVRVCSTARSPITLVVSRDWSCRRVALGDKTVSTAIGKPWHSKQVAL